MTGVITGFVTIAVIIAVGYVIGRINLLGEGGRGVLTRLVYSVIAPCLLFSILSTAHISEIFSPTVAVSALAALTAIVIFGVVALALWRRPLPEAVIGALASGYINANNIGIPVSIYILGSATYAAPIILMQLLLVAPIALAVLDTRTGEPKSRRRIALQPFRNPIIIASALGVIVNLSGLSLPDAITEPISIIGGGPARGRAAPPPARCAQEMAGCA